MQQPSTMEQIAAVEQDLQALLNDNDSELATFHNDRRLARIAEMRAKKEQLWAIERQQRAAKTKLRIEQAQQRQRRR